MVDDSMRWLIQQNEQFQAERRMWLAEDRESYSVASERQLNATRAVSRYMLYRGIIETLILVVLIINLVR